MYDSQLEQLIEIAIKDGSVTETERRVIVNKAIKLGIDEDEILMVLESRLQDRQEELGVTSTNTYAKAEMSHVAHTAEKKCPDCGAPRTMGVKICPDCGFKFPSIVVELQQDLANAAARANAEANKNSRPTPGNGNIWSGIGQNLAGAFNRGGLFGVLEKVLAGDEGSYEDLKSDYQKEVIDNLQVPNDKEDLLELIEFFHVKNKTGEFWYDGENYGGAKELALISAALGKFSGDKAITKKLETYQKNIDL